MQTTLSKDCLAPASTLISTLSSRSRRRVSPKPTAVSAARGTSPVPVRVKNYVLPVMEKSYDSRNSPKKDNLSSDSDLISEVKAYLQNKKSSKERTQEASKSINRANNQKNQQSGMENVLKNIPSTMLMSCAYDEESQHKKTGSKGIFRTYDYSGSKDHDCVKGQKKPEIPKLRLDTPEQSRERQQKTGKDRDKSIPASLKQQRDSSRLQVSLGVFQINISGKDPKPSIVCPHCSNVIHMSKKPSAAQKEPTQDNKSNSRSRSPLYQQGDVPARSRPKLRHEASSICSELFDQLLNRTSTSKDHSKSPLRSSKHSFMFPEEKSGEKLNALKERYLHKRNIPPQVARLDTHLLSKSPINRTYGEEARQRRTDRQRDTSRDHSKEKENSSLVSIAVDKLHYERASRDQLSTGYAAIEARKYKGPPPPPTQKRFR